MIPIPTGQHADIVRPMLIRTSGGYGDAVDVLAKLCGDGHSCLVVSGHVCAGARSGHADLFRRLRPGEGWRDAGRRGKEPGSRRLPPCALRHVEHRAEISIAGSRFRHHGPPETITPATIPA